MHVELTRTSSEYSSLNSLCNVDQERDSSVVKIRTLLLHAEGKYIIDNAIRLK